MQEKKLCNLLFIKYSKGSYGKLSCSLLKHCNNIFPDHTQDIEVQYKKSAQPTELLPN